MGVFHCSTKSCFHYNCSIQFDVSIRILECWHLTLAWYSKMRIHILQSEDTYFPSTSVQRDLAVWVETSLPMLVVLGYCVTEAYTGPSWAWKSCSQMGLCLKTSTASEKIIRVPHLSDKSNYGLWLETIVHRFRRYTRHHHRHLNTLSTEAEGEKPRFPWSKRLPQHPPSVPVR